MVPIFYSQYSGKSLFTFDTPEKAAKNNKQSISKLCVENNIVNPVVVDYKMTGVMELFQNFNPIGLNPRFGLNCKFSHDLENAKTNWHRIIIFIKNTKGYKDLILIHNLANIKNGGFVSPEIISKYWTENLKIAIPFYDSFLFRNTMFEGVSCLPEFGELNPSYFVEDNELPFDDLISSKITKNKVSVKTVLYEKNEDFVKWLTYRCALNFSNKGKNRTLESPMFDHCHSKQFSFESYLKIKERKTNA